MGKSLTVFLYITIPEQGKQELKAPGSPAQASLKCSEMETFIRNKVPVCVPGGNKTKYFPTGICWMCFWQTEIPGDLSCQEEYSTEVLGAEAMLRESTWSRTRVLWEERQRTDMITSCKCAPVGGKLGSRDRVSPVFKPGSSWHPTWLQVWNHRAEFGGAG